MIIFVKSKIEFLLLSILIIFIVFFFTYYAPVILKWLQGRDELEHKNFDEEMDDLVHKYTKVYGNPIVKESANKKSEDILEIISKEYKKKGDEKMALLFSSLQWGVGDVFFQLQEEILKIYFFNNSISRKKGKG